MRNAKIIHHTYCIDVSVTVENPEKMKSYIASPDFVKAFGDMSFEEVTSDIGLMFLDTRYRGLFNKEKQRFEINIELIGNLYETDCGYRLSEEFAKDCGDISICVSEELSQL